MFEQPNAKKIFIIAVGFLGFIGTLITIYSFFYSSKAAVLYEIISETNVIEIKSEIKNLDIVYKGKSFTEEHKNLLLVTLKVINNGNVDIVKNSFDYDCLWGLKVDNGNLIEKPEIINASNEYVKSMAVFLDSLNQVRFSPIIFDENDYFTLRLLIIHSTEKVPQILPVGKISGVKEVRIVNSMVDKVKKTFLEEVFYGNLYIQATRILFYFLISIIILLIIAGCFKTVSNLRVIWERKKHVKLFLKTIKREPAQFEKTLFNSYVKNNFHLMKQIEYVAEHTSEFILEKEDNNITSKSASEIKEKQIKGIIFTSKIVGPIPDQYVIKFMKDNGIIEKNVINLECISKIQDFLKFIDNPIFKIR